MSVDKDANSRLENIKGAFWLNNQYVPNSLEELREILSYTKGDFNVSMRSFSGPNSYNNFLQAKESAILHAGNVIGMYSDSQIPDLNERILKNQEAQLQLIKDNEVVFSEEYFMEKERIQQESYAIHADVSSELRRTLGKIRAFGTPLDAGLSDNHPLKDSMADASTIFPSQWNLTAGRKPFKTVIADRGIISKLSSERKRSYYSPDKKLMSIVIGDDDIDYAAPFPRPIDVPWATDDYRRTFVKISHEMSHFYEGMSSEIIDMESVFYDRRTTDAAYGKREINIVGYPGEKFRLDHFVNAYTGKYYGLDNRGVHWSYEVFSKGIDSVFGGRDGSLIGLDGKRTDIEHRNLVLGILSLIDIAK